MTLRLRLLLVLVGIVAAGLLVSDIVTYSQLQSFLVKRLNQQLQAAPDPVAFQAFARFRKRWPRNWI